MLKTAFTKTKLKFVNYEDHKKFQRNHFERNPTKALNNYSSNYPWLVEIFQKRKKNKSEETTNLT